MDEIQKKAIRSLESSFRKCAKANISFYGCDGDLYAADSKILTKVLREIEKVKDLRGHTIPEIMGRVEDAGGWSDFVKTSGTYQDSGGA